MDVNMSSLLLLVAFAVSIASNGLASSGAFGKGIKDISDENPTFVTPDGLTFAVWGLIYSLWTILVAAQLCPSEAAEELLGRKCRFLMLTVHARLIIACLLNAIWLPVYVSEYFFVAFGIIVLYWGTLVSIYLDVNTKKVSSFFDWLAYAAPVAANASWVTVATCANFFTCGRVIGWKVPSHIVLDPTHRAIGGSVEAAMVVCVLVALAGTYLAIANRSIMWSAVAAWALQGIYRMQTIPDEQRFPKQYMSSKLANTAAAASFAPMAATALAVGVLAWDFLKKRGESSESDDEVAILSGDDE